MTTDPAQPVAGQPVTLTFQFTPLTAGQYEVSISYLNGPVSGETGHFDRNFNVIDGGSIPEFPSIAVPVVAVLGIIIICGRRKL
jgi:hypothetical protein